MCYVIGINNTLAKKRLSLQVQIKTFFMGDSIKILKTDVTDNKLDQDMDQQHRRLN